MPQTSKGGRQNTVGHGRGQRTAFFTTYNAVSY